jgi:hypothetical protein
MVGRCCDPGVHYMVFKVGIGLFLSLVPHYVIVCERTCSTGTWEKKRHSRLQADALLFMSRDSSNIKEMAKNCDCAKKQKP